MSRQFFMDTLIDPPIADVLTNTTVTTEFLMWDPAVWSPIPAYDGRPGKIYKVSAGGVITFPATTGSITLTPRYGLLVNSPSLGASGAQVSQGAATRPWWLELTVVIRTTPVAGGATAAVAGWGFFAAQGLLTATSAPFLISFGGTAASTGNTGVATGIGVTMIWTTTAGSITTQFVNLQSLN